MNKQFCNYEIALELKELGFDEECICVFDSFKNLRGAIIGNIDGDYIKRDKWDDRLSAPLYQQVQSFLDSKGVIIGTIFVDNVFKYTLNIENYVSEGFKDRMSAIKNATEHAVSYLWNQKFSK